VSLVYPYVRVGIPNPAIALGGCLFRPRPIIPISLTGPAGTRLVRGLLDTGADDTVFPEGLAPLLGIDLTNAPEGQVGGFTGAAMARVRFAAVTLRLATNTERREWKALVGFSAAPLRHGLLGFAGVLQFFTAEFRNDKEEAELTVNGLYPGT
jgi:hypothetical protein